MKLLFGISFFFVGLFLLRGFLIKKFGNPYTVELIFGQIGCGKTTYMVKLCHQNYLRKKNKWHIFCTSPGIPGSYYLPASQIGKVELPEHSLLLIDEAGILFNNRNYKNFSQELIKYFKLIRHRKIKVIMFSQAFDIDKTIRMICSKLYIMKPFFGAFSLKQMIYRTLTITDANSAHGSEIVDQLKWSSIFDPGSFELTFNPRFFRFFNSFDVDPLPGAALTYTPFPSEALRDAPGGAGSDLASQDPQDDVISAR